MGGEGLVSSISKGVYSDPQAKQGYQKFADFSKSYIVIFEIKKIKNYCIQNLYK